MSATSPNMMLICPCPACGSDVPVPRHYLSRKVRCNTCLKEFIAKLRQKEEEPLPQATIPLQEPVEGSVEETSPPEAAATSTSAPVEKPETRWLLSATCGILSFAVAAAIGAWAWETHERSLLEQRLAANETHLSSAVMQIRELSERHKEFGGISDDLVHLDDVLASVASETKQQGSTVLRSEYAMQHAHKSLLRQQSDLGKLAERLGVLEREVADKDRQAKEALELATKHRKEADEAAKPMRARIKDLEEQKEKLFGRYKILSTPKRPVNIVSTRRAAAMMSDWERRAEPLLRQLEKEIESVRRSIEDEEFKIEQLYALP